MLDGERLTIEDVVAVAYAPPGEITLRLSAEAEAKVNRARAAVEQFVAEGRIIYGITTGFGRRSRIASSRPIRCATCSATSS